MDTTNNTTVNVENQVKVEALASNQTINYNKGTILNINNVDKYTRENKNSYLIDVETGDKFKIRDSTMLEIAYQDGKNNEFTQFVRNGWEGTGSLSAGAGIAVKMTKTEYFYECIFFEGETGKEFNPKKIQRKTYVKLSKEHLGAIFTFLRCNDEVEKVKAEEKRIQRTTLDLG